MLISFSGPRYSSAIAGHAASRNTFLERLFIARRDFSDGAEFGERRAQVRPISVDSDFQTSFLPVGPAFPTEGPVAPVCLRGWFINKDIDTAGKDLNGGDAKNRCEDIALPRASERNRERVILCFDMFFRKSESHGSFFFFF